MNSELYQKVQNMCAAIDTHIKTSLNIHKLFETRQSVEHKLPELKTTKMNLELDNVGEIYKKWTLLHCRKQAYPSTNTEDVDNEWGKIEKNRQQKHNDFRIKKAEMRDLLHTYCEQLKHLQNRNTTNDLALLATTSFDFSKEACKILHNLLNDSKHIKDIYSKVGSATYQNINKAINILSENYANVMYIQKKKNNLVNYVKELCEIIACNTEYITGLQHSVKEELKINDRMMDLIHLYNNEAVKYTIPSDKRIPLALGEIKMNQNNVAFDFDGVMHKLIPTTFEPFQSIITEMIKAKMNNKNVIVITHNHGASHNGDIQKFMDTHIGEYSKDIRIVWTPIGKSHEILKNGISAFYDDTNSVLHEIAINVKVKTSYNDFLLYKVDATNGTISLYNENTQPKVFDLAADEDFSEDIEIDDWFNVNEKPTTTMKTYTDELVLQSNVTNSRVHKFLEWTKQKLKNSDEIFWEHVNENNRDETNSRLSQQEIEMIRKARNTRKNEASVEAQTKKAIKYIDKISGCAGCSFNSKYKHEHTFDQNCRVTCNKCADRGKTHGAVCLSEKRRRGIDNLKNIPSHCKRLFLLFLEDCNCYIKTHFENETINIISTDNESKKTDLIKACVALITGSCTTKIYLKMPEIHRTFEIKPTPLLCELRKKAILSKEIYNNLQSLDANTLVKINVN